MNAHKISAKLFATTNDSYGESFIHVFHKWIQNQAIADHLLIDVTDYAHVPDGPGTVLISHEANIYADREVGRLGVLYARKQPATGTFADRLRQVIGATFKLAAMLEAEPEFDGKLKFRTDEIAIRINDRLLAPNTAETFAAVQADVKAVASELYGTSAIKIEHDALLLHAFTVTVRAEGVKQPLAALAERVTPAAV